ncbi:hypothetical protein KFL_005110040 [Klebsormidium nitens]|uniref:NAD(P)-binding Rossmann-fold superfamily protein n=1 Tax=Klebsormidium nitens TaxID=105231 RepID=A0A1Y1IGZ2_KLENI|nr:hypothetical protein KFL_005110040 [Klebsormidium nitens]|eukprot:GAQ89322.1 hypothetical protein KFL_005110040 [Klebsormidium nitens]
MARGTSLFAQGLANLFLGFSIFAPALSAVYAQAPPPFPPGSNGSSNGSSGVPPGFLQVSADQPPDTVLGYNLTGFMDTNAYYGPYGNVQTDTNAVPEPNVDASLVPPGCHVFNRWAIANYTGPLPCQTNGQPSPPSGPPCLNIAGRIALVTGASTGIGRAAADRLAAAGAIVIGTSRYPWRYPQPPNWQLYQLDQTSDDSVKQLINRIAANYGEIDFLYLNAGRLFIGDIVNSDLRQFQLTFDTNFWGPVRVLQAALRLMPTTGYARILLTSSIASLYGSPGSLPYTVSKWGLRALQETWDSTGAAPGSTPSNIDVIAIMPGTINTSLGYNAIYGCPQLADAVGGQVIEYYKSQGLNPRDVGEAVYRIAIDPAPRPQYLIMRDDQWPTIIPLLCRSETLPLDQVNVNTPAGPNISAWLSKEAAARSQYTCSAACGGAPSCGPGPLGSGTLGTGTIGPY